MSGKRRLAVTVNNNNGMKRLKTGQSHEKSTASNADILDYDSTNCAGKILKVELQNFMCHPNLSMDFGLRGNLIIGNNGSGKSAILTAVAICLGATANDTQRSCNLKNLVRNGQSSAVIAVDISNEGVDSIEPEKYGNKITVTRYISANGSSRYKIKDGSGKVVSNQKEDLKNILLSLNIQATNPIFILNQDKARTFLKDSNDKNNYKLFLEASQIKYIESNLNQCVAMARENKKRLKCVEHELKNKKEECDNTKNRYDLLLSLADLKDVLQKKSIEMSWCIVQDQENILNKLDANIQEITKKYENIENLINNKQRVLDDKRNCINKTKEEVDAIIQTISNLNEQLATIKKEFNCLKERYEIEKRQFLKLKDKQAYTNQQIETIDNNIAQQSQKSQSYNEERKNKIQSDMKLIENCIQTIVSKIESFNEDLKNYVQTKRNYEQEIENVRFKKNGHLAEQLRYQSEMNRLNKAPKENLTIYGDHIPSLLTIIDKYANKFSAYPRGPIGRYIQVPNKKWHAVVESVLASILHCFLVNSVQDRRILDDIVRKHFPNVHLSIITTKFVKNDHDIQKGMVPELPGTTLVMNQIKCSDTVVRNILIDELTIERILLVQDKSLAIRLTSQEENVPNNLKMVISTDPPMKYFPAPNYRMYYFEIREPRFIEINSEQRIIQLENALTTTTSEIQKCTQQLYRIEKKINDLKTNQKDKTELINELEQKRSLKQNELEELKNEESPREDENQQFWINELDELKRQLTIIKIECEEKKSLLERYEADYKTKEDEYIQHSNKLKTIQNEYNELKAKLDNCIIEETTLQRESKHSEKNYEKYKMQLSELNSNRQIQDEKLKQLLENAENLGERVEVTQTLKELESYSKQLDRRINHISASDDSIDNVKSLLDQRTSEFEKKSELFNEMNRNLETLKAIRKSRLLNLEQIKNFMSMSVNYVFKNLLKLRNYEGNIVINHMEQTLTLSVIPRGNEMDISNSNTKQLSGGERSYATLAFLLSLWESVYHPFYFLDEYDVFTDQINRIAMTKLLVNEIEKKPTRQYFFLTPQDISFLEQSELVRIHRFADPEK